MNGSSSTKNAAYAYDDELRLVQVKSDTGWLFTDTENFILDAVANRTQHSNTGSGVWQYDPNNRLLSRPNADGGTVSYEYDQNGNQTKKTEGTKVTHFIYDSDNRLIEVKDQSNNPIAQYGYDPLNRRLWKEQYRDRVGNPLSQATRTYYLYSDEGLIAEATQAIQLNAGSVTANHEPSITTQYGPRPNSPFTTGVLFVKTKNSNGQDTIAYYHHNHLDTPIQATDKNGNVVWAAQFGAFGQATIITPAATTERPAIISNLRLPGQYEDQETGLYYNWNRFYDPETGRYVTRDPIGLRGGFNAYTYVNGNPLKYTDPLGLEPNQACVAACTAVGALLGGAAGYYGGGALGGLLGGAGGTLVAPGAGTLGGGAVGAVGGSQAGGRAGAAAGAAAGNAAGNAMCPDDNSDDCQKQWEDDVNWCDSKWSRYSRMGEACHRWAEGNRERCMKGSSREPWRL